MKRKHTTVSIPICLYKKIEKKIEGTGFSSVSEWVTYVLREVIAKLEEDKRPAKISQKEEEMIKKRLKALGYL